MQKIFKNDLNVPEATLQRRLSKLDPAGKLANFDNLAFASLDDPAGTIAHYTSITSILDYATLEKGFYAVTAAETNDTLRRSGSSAQAALAIELKTLTPDQAVAYIENNVTSLATAKAVMKIMARMMIAMRDEVWPDLPSS